MGGWGTQEANGACAEQSGLDSPLDLDRMDGVFQTTLPWAAFVPLHLLPGLGQRHSGRLQETTQPQVAPRRVTQRASAPGGQFVVDLS